MKICLYLEFYHFLGGLFFKNIGTGLLSSYKNQKTILQTLNIPYTERWDDSCDILQINTPWLKSLYLIKKAKRQGKKIIVWSHITAEDTLGVFRFAPIIAPIMKRYLTYVYGLVDIVACPSDYTKSIVKAYGLPEQKLIVMSNGVDLRKFYKDEAKRTSVRQSQQLSGVVIGSVGGLWPRKGTATFLNLAKNFPHNQFIWFGKIYSSLMVKPIPRPWPVNIKFTGFVGDVVAAFNSLDIFIFPSYEENQGMVILEAAAVGLPILVRDIPTYQGWLVHNENCLKAKDEEEFKKYLGMLIDDKSLRERLSQNAKILAQGHSINALGQKTLQLYQRLLAKNSG